jgi:ribonuclease P/MRP protein subunit RPP1
LRKIIKEFKTSVELIPGVVIRAKDKNELKTALNKTREKVVIVIVHGGNYQINRVACEDPRVDILAHPELGRADSGLDKACLNLARENNVSIQINFREILYSFRKPRSYIFNHITKNIKLCNEYKTPMVSCSGAQGVWDMRGPRELVSIASVLGLELGRAFASVTSLPQQIVENNKKTLKGERITAGVERVE